MPTLTVTDFSCLKEATFNLATINVIIGPQGSGKSVTTKLFYFCTDILN
jgi:predicted ATPase